MSPHLKLLFYSIHLSLCMWYTTWALTGCSAVNQQGECVFCIVLMLVVPLHFVILNGLVLFFSIFIPKKHLGEDYVTTLDYITGRDYEDHDGPSRILTWIWPLSFIEWGIYLYESLRNILHNE